MALSPPRALTWLLALVLWIVGLLDMLVGLDLPYRAGGWCLVAAGALLLLACRVRGL